jgi:hypothetical protein
MDRKPSQTQRRIQRNKAHSSSASQGGIPLKVAPDDKEQSKLFIKKAHEIYADEEKSAADALMGLLAKSPPEPRIKPKPK